MKYRIEFPIRKTCELFCWYCYHTDYFNKKGIYENNKEYERGFTLKEFDIWINKFLFKSEEILISPHGGETFINENIPLLKELLEYDFKLPITFEFLSNGLSFPNNYEILKDHIKRIKRMGFTFHRTMLSKEQIEQFKETVLYVKSFNVPIYVKELLFTDYREEIKKNIEFWKQYDIPVKVQDFKGIGGKNSDEYSKYTQDDLDLIDEEYRHPKDKFCECLSGYKQILIFGYDNVGKGIICGCWRDQKIVGNIKDMWYNKNYLVDRKLNSSKRIVVGVPENYYKDEECK